jgi:hypothetical protein
MSQNCQFFSIFCGGEYLKIITLTPTIKGYPENLTTCWHVSAFFRVSFRYKNKVTNFYKVF